MKTTCALDICFLKTDKENQLITGTGMSITILNPTTLKQEVPSFTTLSALDLQRCPHKTTKGQVVTECVEAFEAPPPLAPPAMFP